MMWEQKNQNIKEEMGGAGRRKSVFAERLIYSNQESKKIIQSWQMKKEV